MFLHIYSVADLLGLIEKNLMTKVYHAKPRRYDSLQVLIKWIVLDFEALVFDAKKYSVLVFMGQDVILDFLTTCCDRKRLCQLFQINFYGEVFALFVLDKDEGSPVTGYILKELRLEELFTGYQGLRDAQELDFLRVVFQAINFRSSLLVVHGKEVDATGLNELKLTLQVILDIVL